jgi:hypothetical protein
LLFQCYSSSSAIKYICTLTKIMIMGTRYPIHSPAFFQFSNYLNIHILHHTLLTFLLIKALATKPCREKAKACHQPII